MQAKIVFHEDEGPPVAFIVDIPRSLSPQDGFTIDPEDKACLDSKLKTKTWAVRETHLEVSPTAGVGLVRIDCVPYRKPVATAL